MSRTRALALQRHQVQRAARAAVRTPARTARTVALSPFWTGRVGMGAGAHVGARSDRRALQEWNPVLASADAEVIPDGPALRARSRDLFRNAPLATAAILTNLTTVVGPGLRPRPRVDRELLKLDEEQADAIERQMVRWWTLWASEPHCDLTRRTNFAGLCHQVLWGELVDGDIVALRRWKLRPGDPFAVRVQLVEADRISNPNWQPDTDRLSGGVELDDDGAPAQLHVLNRHPGDLFLTGADYRWDAIPVYGPVSRQRQLLHHYHPLRPNQSRGVPYLTPVIEVLRQLDRLKDNELMASVLATMFTAFVTSPAAGDPDAETFGLTTPTSDEDPTTPARTLDSGQLRLGQGMIVDLAPGEDIKIADPERPSGKFDPFFLALARIVGAALEIPVSVLLKQFTASYSASRAEIMEAWRAFLTRRQRLVSGFCQPVYRWVIAEGVARGAINAPGFFTDPFIRAAWLRATWTGPVQGHIQPAQEASAIKTRIDIGLTTLEEETANATGGDWEQNHAQSAKERRMRKRDGLDTESVGERVLSESTTRQGAAEPAADNGSDTEDETRGGQDE